MSVTVAVMEVPRCQALPLIVKKGMEVAGKKIPMEKVIIGIGGNILERTIMYVSRRLTSLQEGSYSLMERGMRR